MNTETSKASPRGTVRPVVEGDAPGIISLIAGIYADYGLTLDAEEPAERHLLAPGPYFRASGGEFWVVDVEGEVKATVAVVLREDAGELKALYVHPDLRRQGWGRRLSELAMDYARGAGKRRMILWSDTRFQDAHRLYRGIGFRECGLRDLGDSNNSIEYGFEITL
ncbi:MAG TPA: GNAT family N-acetyltransferase [Pyrinomonadaceae bacterium]|jgi:GNAT superfamily N-acetyltransferase|nr:GNAT family N-acetyltransferase [Pyrinomonadaceae bacterium]